MILRMMQFLCFVPIVINFSCINDAPVDMTYTVEGFVTDSENGEPVDSVLVRAVSYSISEDRWRYTHTDDQGFYTLSLGDTTYIDLIEYRRQGYGIEYKDLKVNAIPVKNNTMRIDVELNPFGDCPWQPFPPLYPAPYGSPTWHPDGRITLSRVKILKIDRCTGRVIEFDRDSSGVWMINPDGTGLQKLLPYGSLSFSYGLTNPAWSPDGQWIAFGTVHIYKMQFRLRFDTTSVVQLTTEGRNFFPAWSPDGNWIAYRRSYAAPESPAIQGIWIMQSNGNQRKQVFSGNTDGPAWDPIGSYLVFFRGVTDKYGHVLGDSLWRFSLETESLESITFLRGDNSHPRYSPDGTKIAFRSQEEGSLEQLWVMDSDGKNPRQLTTEGVGTSFSWSPTGSHIVYTQDNPLIPDVNNGTVWIMNADGSNKRQLTFNHDLKFFP